MGANETILHLLRWSLAVFGHPNNSNGTGSKSPIVAASVAVAAPGSASCARGDNRRKVCRLQPQTTIRHAQPPRLKIMHQSRQRSSNGRNNNH